MRGGFPSLFIDGKTACNMIEYGESRQGSVQRSKRKNHSGIFTLGTCENDT